MCMVANRKEQLHGKHITACSEAHNKRRGSK